MTRRDPGPDGFKPAGVQLPSTEQRPDGTIRESHPAFAVVSVTRSSGTPRALFQSDLRHQETITLTINEAERIRDLNHDRVHPTRQVVEIEMSLAQWGSVVSSIGLGSGVPVTLRWRDGDGHLPRLPYLPRIRKSLDEVNSAVDKLMERALSSFAVLTEAVEEKKGVRAIKEALRTHGFSLSHARNNTAFAVTSLAEAAEFVTSQARADIEAHILTAASYGIGATVAFPPLELEEIDAQELS